MAKFNMADADKYSQSSGGSYFSLKDDGQTARVRILYGSLDDIEGYAVYRVKVGDRERYVNSLRAYNEPIEKDPFAMAGYKTQAKMFIPLYNLDTEEVQFWERGKTYYGKVAGLANRYNPLYNEIVEIERNGAKGDMKTTYEIFPIEHSEFDMNSIDIPSPLGTTILDKTYEEMEYYVQHGEFPDETGQMAERRHDNYQRQNDMPTGRRTPSEGRRAF